MSRAVELPRAEAMEERAAAGQASFRESLDALRRYGHLLRNLVAKDLKLKYRGSVFGFVWSLANPIVMIVVYTIAFTWILPTRVEGFVFYLLLGILSWTFFANSMMMASGSIADNGGLVKSVRFPRAILPAATVLFNLAQYLLTVLVLLPIMLIAFAVPPSPTMLLFPVVLLLQTVFTAGLAMVIATATAFFRDVRHLVEVALAVLFWTTPIVYELSMVPAQARPFVLASPMSPFVAAYHDVVFYRQWPQPAIWTLTAGYAILAATAGLFVMRRFEDRLAEQI